MGYSDSGYYYKVTKTINSGNFQNLKACFLQDCFVLAKACSIMLNFQYRKGFFSDNLFLPIPTSCSLWGLQIEVGRLPESLL
ncbi:unnamed protein product [Camellia sinensis]